MLECEVEKYVNKGILRKDRVRRHQEGFGSRILSEQFAGGQSEKKIK